MTGVQTCALPISVGQRCASEQAVRGRSSIRSPGPHQIDPATIAIDGHHRTPHHPRGQNHRDRCRWLVPPVPRNRHRHCRHPCPVAPPHRRPRSITWLKIPGSVGPLNDPGASDSPDSGAKHHRPIRPGDTRPAGHAVTDREKPDHRQSPGHHSFRRLLEPCAYDVRPPRDPGGRLTARVVWPIPPPPAPTAVRADR